MLTKNTFQLQVAGSILLYSVALVAFQLGALPIYSDAARWLAWGLFVLGTWPMIRFLRSSQSLPLLELVILNYVLFFAAPLFYSEELSIYIGTIVPSISGIELTLLCAIIGIVMLQIGFHFSHVFFSDNKFPQLQFTSDEHRLFLFAVVTLIGRMCIDLNLLSVSPSLERIAGVMLSSDLGIALFSLLYYRGGLSRNQRFIVLSLVSFQIFTGLASGMAQGLLQPMLIWYLCRWFVTKEVPYRQFIIFSFIFILVQPVKLNYRQNVWYSGKSFSLVEKIGTYSSLFWDHWFGKGEFIDKISDTTAGRLSLLLQSAHVIERTPSMVPYQNGDTLLYMAYGWVPRFLWPDKPIAQQTNIDFGRNYGIQHPDTVDTTRIGIGHLAEAYINFGVAGIFIIYFCLGFLYNLPLAIVHINNRDFAALAIISSILVSYIFIGSTIGNVFGGIIQQIVVQGILLKYFCRSRGIQNLMNSTYGNKGRFLNIKQPDL